MATAQTVSCHRDSSADSLPSPGAAAMQLLGYRSRVRHRVRCGRAVAGRKRPCPQGPLARAPSSDRYSSRGPRRNGLLRSSVSSHHVHAPVVGLDDDDRSTRRRRPRDRPLRPGHAVILGHQHRERRAASRTGLQARRIRPSARRTASSPLLGSGWNPLGG